MVVSRDLALLVVGRMTELFRVLLRAIADIFGDNIEVGEHGIEHDQIHVPDVAPSYLKATSCLPWMAEQEWIQVTTAASSSNGYLL